MTREGTLSVYESSGKQSTFVKTEGGQGQAQRGDRR